MVKFFGNDIKEERQIFHYSIPCIKDECIINFVDNSVKHIHYHKDIVLY